MACIIKIKTNDGYLTFTNEESAKEFMARKIASGELSFDDFSEEFPTDEKTGKVPEEQTSKIIKVNIRGKNGTARKLITMANKRSHSLTKEVYDRLDSEGLNAKDNWDTEEFDKASDIIGAGKFLQQLRIGDKRLFPEFVSKNYQNTLIIKNLLKQAYFQKHGTEILEPTLVELSSEIFDLLNFSAEESVLSAKEWKDKLVALSDIDLKEELKNLTDDQITKAENDIIPILKGNIMQLFRGEVYHVISEKVCKNKGSKGLNAKKEWNELSAKFKTRYAKCQEILDLYGSIDNFIVELGNYFFDSSKDNLFEQYIKSSQLLYEDVIRTFQTKGSNIEIIPEQRFTLRIDDPELQETAFGHKNYLQCKIDMIVLVDGVAHIVDIKTIKDERALDNDSVKLHKTTYVMALYKRVLERLGMTVGSTLLYKVYTDPETGEPKNLKLQDISNEVGASSIQTNIDRMVKNIHYSKLDLKVDNIQYTEYKNKLFGEQKAKAKKHFDIETLKKEFDIEEKAEYTEIKYTLINEKGKRVEHRHKVKKDEDLQAAIETIAEKVLRNREQNERERFKFIKSSLIDIINGSKDPSSMHSYEAWDKEARYYAATFLKYKNAKRVIEVDGLDDLGIILIETDSGVDVLSITTANIFSSWDVNDSKKKLFDSIGISSDYLCNVGSVSLITAALVANNIVKCLDVESKTINEVKVIQEGALRNYYLPNSELKKIMRTVCSELELENYFEDNTTDPFVSALCSIAHVYTETNVPGKKNRSLVPYPSGKKLNVGSESIEIESFADIAEEIRSISEQSSVLQKQSKIEFLRETERMLVRNSGAFSKDPSITPSKITEIELLRAVITRAINELSNRSTIIDQDVSLYNFNNGVMLNSIDMVGVKVVHDIREIIEQGNTKISLAYGKYQSQMRAQIKQYHESIGYTGAKKYLGGRVAPIYSRLFRRDKDNNFLDNDLILRNPWDPKENLSAEDKAFLKFVLFTLNKYKHSGWKSVEDMKETQLTEKDYYFPLCRHSNVLDKIIDADGSINLPKFKTLSEDFVIAMDSLTSNSAENKDERRKVAEELGAIYNEHANRTDLTTRKSLIDTYGLEAFMVDIHTALNVFVMSMESQKTYDRDVIPLIKSILYAQMFDEIESNILVDNTKKFTKKFLASAVYQSPVYEKEVERYMKIAAPFRSVASSIALSWNLVNLPRERLMGIFTTISRSMFATYGENTFGIKNYLKAWKTMGYDMVDFVRKITKIELLNEHFRLVNTTVSELPEQTTSSRTGFYQTFSRWMSWTLVAPDYMNRMTIFIAQMMEDGCWEAYTLDETNGPELKYDMSKDKRFDVLCRYNGDLDSVPAEHKTIFLQQLALYEVKRDELNEFLDEKIPAIDKSNTKWYLPTAYTPKERNSLKSFADSTFGYYDNDTKAWFYKTAVGLLFKQFMAYVSAKKVQYFKSATDKTDRGNYEQLTTTSGEKLWKIIITNEQGKDLPKVITEKELNSTYSQYKESARPAYGWKGAFVEGIVNSYWNLLTDFAKVGKLYFYDGDVESKNKAKQLLSTMKDQYGKRGHIRNSNLLQGLWDLWISIGLMWLFRIIFFDDPETTGESYKSQLKDSTPLFQLSYSLLSQATSDFNVAVLMYNQLFDWRMPAVSIIQNTGKSFWRALGDEDLTWYEGLEEATVNSLGILKPIRPFANTYFEEAKQN